ncbi:cytochrome ubiquinol oxidase subunit I [Micromonospora olivasterospora]|uniref:Bd-type cytochrome oxidase subunit I n=1 Tax=Micromonospora olivasterospora TaxID=1880 RepID=A0A562IC91_MICOL|nr:cytochrome ubiquinol oxidase subunit I [Micromonospora olivasterospora]TWH68325.1 bd-type cytochrome oxidase subunit I [Micromonospora olivasterospora]
MDPLLLARLQFATTTSVHFLFVVVTLGLVTLLVGLQTAWVVTGNPAYERLTRFWGLLYVINYGQFQFGVNYPPMNGRVCGSLSSLAARLGRVRAVDCAPARDAT